jgi:DNA mismatch repair protein MutS
MSETTPMMSQYLQIREQYRDAVLFFRLGDFYEMFNEDAVEVSRLLGLTLTHRAGNPMCGIPYHASKVYIARLLRAGKKIAICEQLSIPGPGKGLAERKVVEVITPGTAVEDDYLDRSQNNYLACLSVSSEGNPVFGFSYIDVTTGEFAATSFGAVDAAERFRKEAGRIQPKEILVQQSILSGWPEIAAVLDEYPAMVKNRYPDWSFNRSSAFKRLCTVFGTTSLKAFSLDESSPELPSAGLLLEYLGETAFAPVSHVSGIRIFSESEFVSLDDSTRKNLELDRNLRDGGCSYTLFEILNQTRTSMGARLLRSWIHHPLTDSGQIRSRLEAVRALYRKQKLLAKSRDILSDILDIERLAGRVAMERAHGKDLVALGKSLERFIALDEVSRSDAPGIFEVSDASRDCAADISGLVSKAILEDCPIALNEGGIIKAGWSQKLDELRSLRDNSNAVLEAYLEEERARTGISNLKIRYNRMIGYFLEVTKGNLSSVPSHFIRRRSLANGDRYTTDRLVELETELNGVHANIIECEQALFVDIRKQIFAHIREIVGVAHAVAQFDVLQSFAWAATQNAWVEPELSSSGVMRITDGRHPVVEAHVPTGEFVPNSIALSSEGPASGLASFALITGPNMAGKSTFLRQTALIVLMAQIGSFVPAAAAELSVVDRIFCRVGASDNLARGESTFLVEMTETAHILRSATKQSLVIMDEVGRGTSTEDGLSIAQAVTEFLLEKVGAKTLFATHYHELSRLSHPALADYCLDVLETEGTVVFLKKVKEGASANSFGIHVARLAGVPEPVLARASEILKSLPGLEPAKASLQGEQVPLSASVSAHIPAKPAGPLLFSEEELVLDDLLSIDVNSLTPIDALKKIDAWKKRLYPSG